MVSTGATPEECPDAELAALLLAREQALLTPEVRESRAALESMLAPEFCEFGSSGRVFDRAAIVSALEQESDDFRSRGEPDVQAFKCTRLGPEAALVTYRIVRAGSPASLRSSVWVLQHGQWMMVFHQGTRAPQMCRAA